MARTKVKLNHSGVQKILDEVSDSKCRPIAEAGAARARGSAPRDTGAYAASIHVYSAQTDRKVWRYGSELPYAAAVEADTGNLRRSL